MDAQSQVARRRLYPSMTDPNYLVLRSRRLIFTAWAKQLQGKRLTVLDIGGRYQPYRPLFENVDRYVAVDLVRTELVDIVADAERLPIAQGKFDVVIATQVFDCFKDPAQAVKTIAGVLKTGGVLLAGFPACAPRFADIERWRFTASGLQLMMEPFDEVEIVPELYSVAGVIRTVNVALDTFVRYAWARWAYRLTFSPLLNLLGLGVEKLRLTSNDQFTPNYSVRAVKAG
jgi:SAM-dependent methyltransferase